MLIISKRDYKRLNAKLRCCQRHQAQMLWDKQDKDNQPRNMRLVAQVKRQQSEAWVQGQAQEQQQEQGQGVQEENLYALSIEASSAK